MSEGRGQSIPPWACSRFNWRIPAPLAPLRSALSAIDAGSPINWRGRPNLGGSGATFCLCSYVQATLGRFSCLLWPIEGAGPSGFSAFRNQRIEWCLWPPLSPTASRWPHRSKARRVHSGATTGNLCPAFPGKGSVYQSLKSIQCGSTSFISHHIGGYSVLCPCLCAITSESVIVTNKTYYFICFHRVTTVKE